MIRSNAEPFKICTQTMCVFVQYLQAMQFTSCLNEVISRGYCLTVGCIVGVHWRRPEDWGDFRD